MPAAAVIQRPRALSGFIGRKASVGVLHKSPVKAHRSTVELPGKLAGLRLGEVSGIAGVVVKCVNIGKNTKGEGSLLEHT